ncbi:MAG: methyl-accepting chemotaxis protein [Pseudomonadota bacterium]
MNIANMKIGHRLNISFALTIALLALVVAVGASRLAVVSTAIDLTVGDRYEKISLLNQARNTLELQARTLRNALLSTDSQLAAGELASAEALTADVARQFDQVSTRIRLPAARALLARVELARAAFASSRDKLIALARAGRKDEAAALLFSELRVTQLAYFGAIDQLVDFQAQLMRETGSQARESARLASLAMIALGVTGAVLSMLTAWFITRGIVLPVGRAVAAARTVAGGDLSHVIEVHSNDETGQLSRALRDMNESLVTIVTKVRSGTDTIARASAEIAAGNEDLSQRTEQQAGQLEETVSSMAQLTSTVRQNAHNAREANSLAQSASEVAGQGGAVVEQVVRTMEAINVSSRKIVDITGVIDAIAFQTNILALNAAVEAARAGEQGRGFAVVAGEVRNLAQRSAAAAKEIKLLIDQSVRQVGSGAQLVGEAGRTMADIVDSVRRVTDIMGQISAASVEQMSGIEQVNQAIGLMDQVTQQNAALVEQAAAAAGAMREQAQELSAVVGVFKLAPAARAPATVLALTRSPRGRLALPPARARKRASR